jgi:hypothetical protein
MSALSIPETASIQPEDNAGYDMRSMMKLNAVTLQIEDILRRFGPGTSNDIAIAAKFSRAVFGIDVRTSAINRLSEQEIIDMIPKAEGCLMALQALETMGYIHARNNVNFFEKFMYKIRLIYTR